MSQLKARKSIQLNSNKKSVKPNGYSLHQLHQLDQGIESDKKQIKLFVEQLKQERTLARNMERTMNESMVKVEDQAVSFASKLEEEKRKHDLLTRLVKYHQELILTEKKEKYEEEKKMKYGTQSEAIEHELKNIEKECEQLTLKKNASSYEVSKKIDQIRTLRSQRTVFSAVFDQFQRQFFESEHNYRQLVIEKSALESRYQEKVKIYQHIDHQTEQLCQIARERVKNATGTEIEQQTQRKISNKHLSIAEQSLPIPPIANSRLSVIMDTRKSKIEDMKMLTMPASNHPVTLGNDKEAVKSRMSSIFRGSQISARKQMNDTRKVPLTSSWGNAGQRQKSIDRNADQIDRLECQKKVKDVKNFEEIERVFEQEKPELFTSRQNTVPLNSQKYFPVLQANLDQLHQETERLFERIYEQQRKIKERNEANNNKLAGDNRQNEHEIRLQDSIQGLSEKEDRLKEQLAHFNGEEVKKLSNLIDSASGEGDIITIESIESSVIDLLRRYQAKTQHNNVTASRNKKVEQTNANHLELILNPNKATKNTSIYTSSEMIEISKLNLYSESHE